MTTREISAGLQYQGVDEVITYTITTTNWVSSPTSPTVVVKNENGWSDVTSTVMPTNSPSVSGDVITLSPLTSLTAPHVYRIEVKFVVGANTYEAYFRVQAEN